MLSILASVLLNPSIQKWQSGDLTVEINKGSNSWRILLKDDSEIYQSKNIQSIAYALLKEKELTLTGKKNGRTFFTKLTPSSADTLHLETNFLPDNYNTADHLLEEFAIPEALPLISTPPGLSPTWKSPFLLYSSEKTSIAIWPDLTNWNLTIPMLASMESGKVGYQNATPNEDGSWTASDAPRLINSKSQISFYIKANPHQITESEVKSILWNQEANRYRSQSHPQQVPMSAAAAITFKFDHYPALQLFDPPETKSSSSLKRWKTFSIPGDPSGVKLGLPDGQNDTIQLTSKSNAMRVATTMYSWGHAKNLTSWQENSDQLIALIVAGSPENGFSTTIVAKNNEFTTPAPFTSPANSGEAATAFYATKLLSEFPNHPLKTQLTARVLGVLKRSSSTAPGSEIAALIALAAKQDNLTAEIQQIAIENLIPLQATFNANRPDQSNYWNLEALYWLTSIYPGQYRAQIKQAVESHLDNQSLIDIRGQDQLASLGAFQTSNGTISTETASLASIIGRLGIALDEPEWLDRAAFALRSLHSLYEANSSTTIPELVPSISLGVSSPGFGNVLRNEPDPRTNFESCEGLLSAATWELISITHGAYIFPNGRAIGVDGLAASPENNILNSLLGNPNPFARSFQEGIKSASSLEILPSSQIGAYPAISSLKIDKRDNNYFLVANPGHSLTSVQIAATGTFVFGSKKFPATKGEKGFETKLIDLSLHQMAVFVGKVGNFNLQAKSNLPEGSPISWATTTFEHWYRTGDYRWSGTSSISSKGKVWLSTGDLGNGTEAPWMTGLFYTPWLNINGKALEFTASGTGDCRIMLVDENERTVLDSWFPENNESKVKFDLSALTGHRVKIVIQDRDPNGVIRLTNLKVSN